MIHGFHYPRWLRSQCPDRSSLAWVGVSPPSVSSCPPATAPLSPRFSKHFSYFCSIGGKSFFFFFLKDFNWIRPEISMQPIVPEMLSRKRDQRVTYFISYNLITCRKSLQWCVPHSPWCSEYKDSFIWMRLSRRTSAKNQAWKIQVAAGNNFWAKNT